MLRSSLVRKGKIKFYDLKETVEDVDCHVKRESQESPIRALTYHKYLEIQREGRVRV